MQTILSTELYWLSLTVLFTAVMWVPYIINRMAEQGVLPALWDPYGHTEAHAAWANRMMQAHDNAVENLVIFIPLVLIVQINNLNSEITSLACMLYFMSRLVHFAGFTLAVPLVRVLSFLTGFFAQMVLLFVLLS